MADQNTEELQNLNKSHEIRIEKNDNEHLNSTFSDQVSQNQNKQINTINTSVKIQKEDEESPVQQLRQQKLNGVMQNIMGNLPASYKATMNDIFLAIELKFDLVRADTRRAARFDKVRNAVALYNMVQDPSDKYTALLGVREAAANYLIERKKGSYKDRKTLCEDIVKGIDGIIEIEQLEKAHDPSFLLRDDVNMPDELLDAELANAYKHACEDDKKTVPDIDDRRKAYKRKIKDVKLAYRIKSRIEAENQSLEDLFNETNNKYELQVNENIEGYDYACDQVVMAYSKLYISHKEDIVNLVRVLNANGNVSVAVANAKRESIIDIILKIMSWDPKEFEFKKPEDFLNDGNTEATSINLFMDKYNKLMMAAHADYLLAELYQMEGDGTFSRELYKEINARLQMYKAMAIEYQNRLDLMSNPYYALLLEEDTARFKKTGGISKLNSDKDIPGVDSKLETSQTFRDYVDAVCEKQDNLRSDNNNGIKDPAGRLLGKGSIFKRGTDAMKLLAFNRKRFGANSEFDESELEKIRVFNRLSLREAKNVFNDQ